MCFVAFLACISRLARAFRRGLVCVGVCVGVYTVTQPDQLLLLQLSLQLSQIPFCLFLFSLFFTVFFFFWHE